MSLKRWIRTRTSEVLAPASQDRAQRAVVRSLRTFSGVFSRMADFLENQRMQRSGTEPQGTFLERLDLREQRPPPAGREQLR
ncbi:MAG TPA: hypothetical protein VK013_14525 [Myxococcaceae bacterium]|nr:hypothetical protein [Myxococcaceae bacterium]